MAHSLSAKKRIRQNIKRRMINRARKSNLKGQLRRFDDALHARDFAAAAEQLKLASRALDRVAAKGAIHRNEASRRKSRLQKKLNQLHESAAA